MDGYRTHFVWITILCLIQDYGSCSDIIEGPKNVTVLSGSDASFRCTVGSGWQSLSWYIQDIYIININPTGTTVSTPDTINVQNSTNATTGAFTSQITIVNVKRTDAGSITCSSFSAPSHGAYLSVQVSGSVEITNGSVTVSPNSSISMICLAVQWYPAPTITWQINNTAADTSYYSTRNTIEANDFVTALSTFEYRPDGDLSLTCLASIETLTQPHSATVNITVMEHIPGSSSSLSQTDIILIAVFASLGGLLLLIIIILIIIFCCKRNKKKKTESGYQSDARKAPEEKNNNLGIMNRNSLGENNFAYVSDIVPVKQSFGSIGGNDSTCYDNISTSTASNFKDPAQTRTDDHLKAIRHVTHV